MYIHSKVHLLFHRIVRSCLILSRFLVTLISSQEEHLKEIQSLQAIIETLKKEQEESKLRLDEERLEVVEAKRKIEEERQVLEKELKQKEKMIQNQILGKSEANSRPRISFGMAKKK